MGPAARFAPLQAKDGNAGLAHQAHDLGHALQGRLTTVGITTPCGVHKVAGQALNGRYLQARDAHAVGASGQQIGVPVRHCCDDVRDAQLLRIDQVLVRPPVHRPP